MNKIKRYLSFTLALIMILGMVVPPSPVSAEEKNEDVPYTIENINGVTYKVYDFTDLFGKDSLKEETSEATIFNDELGISALNVPQAVGEAQIKPGDPIPGGYKLTVDWGCYDLKASDIGTDIRLMIRDRDSREIIAQTDPITAQSNGIEYYEFKATDKWNDAGTHHQPKVDGVTKWSLVTPASILFEVRVKTNDHTGWDAGDISFIVAQQASTIYRAEYYSNSQNLPSIEAQKTNTKDKKRKVEINNKNLSDNEYYSFGDQEDRFLKNKPYFKGKELKIIEYGTDDLESLKVSDSITAERAKIAIKVPGSNDFNRVGSFTDNGVPYHYEVTGDYKSIHLAKLRQDLKVKFDSNGATFAQAVKTEQTIGHSMKVGEKFGNLDLVEIPKENQINNIPKFKDTVNNKELEQKFIGWTLNKTTGADFKDKTEEQRKALLVDFKTYEVKDNVTFYAAYAPLAQGKATVEYVANGTKIDDKYKISTEKYPTEAEGNVGEDVEASKINEPKFIGYKRTTDTIADAVEGKKYKKADSTTTLDIVQVKYEKIDDILGPLKPSDKFPEGYVAVKFFADESSQERGEFTGNKTSVVYAVNPINTEIDTTNKKLSGKKANGDAINVDFPTYTVKQASQDTWKTNETKPWVMAPENAIGTDKKIDLNILGTKQDLTFTAQYIGEQGTVKYEYTYDKSAVTAPAEAPADPNFTKAQNKTVDVGTKVVFEPATYDSIPVTENKDGKNVVVGNWKFQGWKYNGAKATEIASVAKGDNIVTGEWKYVPVTPVGVSYKFTFDGQDTQPNVSGELNKFPSITQDNTKYYPGQEITLLANPAVNATVKGTKTVNGEAQPGTWTFNGWFMVSETQNITKYTVKSTDTTTLNFVGKWSFKADDMVDATFEYKYFKLNKNNQEEAVTDKGKFNPTATEKKSGFVGKNITLPAFSDTTNPKKEEIVDKGTLRGTWKFDGWYKDASCITKANNEIFAQDGNKFYGKWILTEDPKYGVTYEFKSADAAKSLPNNITVNSLIGADNRKFYKDEEVTPIKTPTTSYPATIDGKEGAWTFTRWDQSSKKMTENGIKFEGTWTWAEKGKVAVKYVFNTNPADKKLPEVLNKLKPTDITEPIYSDKVVDPAQPDVSKDPAKAALVEKDKDGKEIGTWTPGTWVRSGSVKDGVITYTLTWTFTEAGKPAPEQPPMPEYNPWWPIWFGSTKTEVKKEEPKPLERHDAYISGYPDGTVRPDGKITRAEVSAIFARLTENSAPANYSPKFSDVLAYDWFCDSVMKLSNKDIIKGYPDGTFKPNKSITRAEFAVIASKYIKNPKTADETFSDVPMNHWAKDAIAMVKAEGWISGYTDGTFKPDAPITRAEAVSIVNRMFDRAADGEFVREHGFEITKFGDLSTNHWAYYEMIEATHSHDYERIDKRTERWEKIVK